MLKNLGSIPSYSASEVLMAAVTSGFKGLKVFGTSWVPKVCKQWPKASKHSPKGHDITYFWGPDCNDLHDVSMLQGRCPVARAWASLKLFYEFGVLVVCVLIMILGPLILETPTATHVLDASPCHS